MNLIKRTSLNLSKVQANIIERNISKYFDVTIPKQLKAGKNEIKLKLLRPDIFVEGSSLLIDFYSDNEQNFNYYISEIANADSSRSIIVTINQESVNGPCHLYLMSELRFGGSYLYIIDLEINNELENVQDIKFKSIPEVVYNEDIHPIQNTSNVSRNVTTTSKNQSIGTKPTLIPRQNYKDQFNVERTEVQSSITVSSLSTAGSSSFETLPKYTSPGLIYSDDFKFSGSMVNGTIEVNGLAGNKYVANILRVVDTSSIEVWPPYSDLVSGQLFNSFDNHRNFTCSFKDTVAVANSAYDQSYAVFDLYNLETTVGVLDSINVSYKILNQLGTDFQPIGNFKVESKNLLIDINNFEFDTRYGIVQKQIGKFRSEADFLTYWDSGSIAEVKVYSDDILPNGLRLAPSQNFIFPRLNYKVYGTQNTEFKLSFDYNNKFKGQLDVYITGSNVTSLQIQKRSSNLPDNTYGTYIGSVTERNGRADFEFKLQENGYIRPLFKFGDEVWSLANISLEPRKVIGYSPNQAKIVAPLTLPSGSELTFRLEYLNPSGKKVDNILTDIGGVFFSGGSVPSGGSGSGGGPVSVPDGTVSSSNQLTSSYDFRYEKSGRGLISSSAQVTFSQISGIPSTLVSGSNQLTSSYDTRYERKGTNIFSSSAQVVYSSVTGIPTNLISGSNQLTSSYDTRYELRGNNIVSSSAQVKAFLPANSVSGSDQLTSSYDVRYERKGTNIFSSSAQVVYSSITGAPANLVSGSNQLTSSYDVRYELRGNNIVSSSVQVKAFLPIGSVSGSDQATSSYDTRYERRGFGIVSSSAQITVLLPTGTISSSNQFTSFSSPFTGSFTGSFKGDFKGDGSGLYNIPLVSGSVPMGTVTGSDQLTSSYDTRYERKGTNIFSSSAQVTYSSITGIPTGLVTGSNQLTSSYDTRYERSGNNIVSSSVQVKAFLPLGSVSGSNQLTSSYDSRYERKGTNILSSSQQIASDISGSSNSLSSSFQIRVGNLERGSGSFATTGSNTFVGNQTITGSVIISGSKSEIYDAVVHNPILSGSEVVVRLLNNAANALVLSSSLATAFRTRLAFSTVQQSDWNSNIYYNGSVWNKDDLTRIGWRMTQVPTTLDSTSRLSVEVFKSGSVAATRLLDIKPSEVVFNVPITALFLFSSSQQVIESLPLGTVSGSNQLTSSYDTRYELRGSNILSSSNQFTSFSSPFTGSFTGSFKGDFKGDGSGLYNIPLVSGSVPMGTVTGSDQLTSSYDTRYERKGTNIFSSSAQVTYSSITGIPTGLITGSNQLTSSYDARYELRGNNIVSSSVQVKAFLPIGSISGSDQSTSSYDSRYERRGNNIISSSLQFASVLSPFTGSFTGSFKGDGSGLYNLPISSSSIPAGTVSGSDQLTSSLDIRYEKRGTGIFSSSAQIVSAFPNGIVSGSTQLTSSYDTRYELRGSNIVSSSNQFTSFSSPFTGSFTGSFKGSFTGDGSGLYNIPLVSGSVPMGTVTGSDQLTSSYDTRYERKGTNIFSSSVQVVYGSITGIPTTLISGSNQLTSSYDARYEIRGNNIVSSSAQIKAFLPAASVSGSDQLTSSYDVRYERKGTNIFSSSAQVIYSSITGTPANLVSGSNQLTSSYDVRYEVRGNNIVSSSVQVKAFLPANTISGSDQATSSYDTRYERKGTNIFSSSAQVVYGSITGIPTNLVSGSNQLTSSYDTRYEIRGNNIVSSSVQVKAFLPVGSVSGSDQMTSSYDTRYERKGTNIFSSSAQVLSVLPAGTVTGSNQLTSSYDTRYEIRGNNIVSSSAQVKNFLPSNTVSSSAQFTNTTSPFTGSFTGSFKGDGSGLVNLPISPMPANIISGSDQLTSSYDTRYERKGTNIFSSSAQVVYSNITGIPTNLVSGSNQLTSSYDARYEIKGTNVFSSSGQVNYNEILNKPIISLPQADRLINSDGTVSGSRANDGLQYSSASSWTKLLLRTNVIQEQSYSSSFWTSQWTFVSQSTFVASPTNRNFSVYIPAGFNNDTNTPISSSTFHNSYAIEVENHIYGITGSKSAPLNSYNWNSTTQFRAFYNPANITLSPLISSYVAQSSSIYQGMGGYGNAYAGRPDLNSWYSVTGVSYAGDGLFKVDLSMGPSSSFGWTLYIATTAKVIKHEIRV